MEVVGKDARFGQSDVHEAALSRGRGNDGLAQMGGMSINFRNVTKRQPFAGDETPETGLPITQ